MEAREADRGVDERLYYQDKSGNGETQQTPRLDFRIRGALALSLKGEEAWRKRSPALTQLVEMDPSNSYPEVVFSTYSGGAHCPAFYAGPDI